MRNRPNRRNYPLQSHLNVTETITLPSNLLNSQRSSSKNQRYQHPPHQNANLQTLQIKQFQEPSNLRFQEPSNQRFQESSNLRFQEPSNLRFPQKKKHVIQEVYDHKSHQVLYKRLTSMHEQNKQLAKMPFSKLLSKMVVLGEDKKQEEEWEQLENLTARNLFRQYHCLKGTMFDLPCEDKLNTISTSQQKRQKQVNGRYSSLDQAARTTTKIFKRYYMPNFQKTNPSFFKNLMENQNYVYVNGRKAESKRIHNFYTSQRYRKSYDRAFKL